MRPFPRSAPEARATTDLVDTLKLLPPLARRADATLVVGGGAAVGIDFADVLSSKLPVFVAIA